jgi:uncharacterized protein (DUF1501 family)
MLNRRDFMTRSLQGASLVALGGVVPQFVANTARAAAAGGNKENTLVVIEMTGGNDGLNTVIPYADDLYHKARTTLRLTKEQVVRVNDHIGLNPGMRSIEPMLRAGQLAIVQGVGYPNPDRSHFESMDVWQLGDPRRSIKTGWLARSANELQSKTGMVPCVHIGGGRLPTALQGVPGAAVSINNRQPYRLELGGGTEERHKARRKLLEDLSQPDKDDSLLQFVQRRQLETLTSVEKLESLLQRQQQRTPLFGANGPYQPNSLPIKLQLIASLIASGFGTRVFYVVLDGFDTHSNQAAEHQRLLAQVADGISNFFNTLKMTGHDGHVRVMTFSEFGRRVQENGSKGTDHGAGSCLFVAGGRLPATVVGEHPSLKDLDSGDLKYHTDFRRVYATLLDSWLGCDSKTVLGGKFEHLPGLEVKPGVDAKN